MLQYFLWPLRKQCLAQCSVASRQAMWGGRLTCTSCMLCAGSLTESAWQQRRLNPRPTKSTMGPANEAVFTGRQYSEYTHGVGMSIDSVLSFPFLSSIPLFLSFSFFFFLSLFHSFFLSVHRALQSHTHDMAMTLNPVCFCLLVLLSVCLSVCRLSDRCPNGKNCCCCSSPLSLLYRNSRQQPSSASNAVLFQMTVGYFSLLLCGFVSSFKHDLSWFSYSNGC